MYPILYVDGRIRVKDNGAVNHQDGLPAIGVDVSGRKHALSCWIRDTKGAQFWQHVLADLCNHREGGVLCQKAAATVDLGFLCSYAARLYSLMSPPRRCRCRIDASMGITTAESWPGGSVIAPWWGRRVLKKCSAYSDSTAAACRSL